MEIRTDMQTYIRTYVRTYVRTDVLTYRHADVQTCRRTYVRTDAHTYRRAYRRADLQTYIRRNIYCGSVKHENCDSMCAFYTFFLLAPLIVTNLHSSAQYGVNNCGKCLRQIQAM